MCFVWRNFRITLISPPVHVEPEGVLLQQKPYPATGRCDRVRLEGRIPLLWKRLGTDRGIIWLAAGDSGVTLHLRCSVGVGAESKACVVVAQRTERSFSIKIPLRKCKIQVKSEVAFLAVIANWHMKIICYNNLLQRIWCCSIDAALIIIISPKLAGKTSKKIEDLGIAEMQRGWQ